MPLVCVRVKEPAFKQTVFDEIKRRDPNATLDTTEQLSDAAAQTAFWIDTEIPYWDVEVLTGVADAIKERDVCSCGSGERKDDFLDARGIFCCYYCSACEKEKRAQYRVEVLENSNYEVDEQIEPEYKDDLI
jgi:hypothetical protein